jgi:hypothetical protein
LRANALGTMQQRLHLIIGGKSPHRANWQTGTASLAGLAGKSRWFPRLNSIGWTNIVATSTGRKFIRRIQTALRRKTKRLAGQQFFPTLGKG